MTKRIAITGINGFVGHHLAKELHSRGVGVVGIGREEKVSDRVSALVDEYVCADLSKEWPNFSEPITGVIHLAGLAAVGPSFDNPQTYININSAIITQMCESYLRDTTKIPRIVVVSSGAIYDSSQPMPISEEGSVGFSSPYSVSKILVENQCEYYRTRGLDCVIVRPFNHIGPGQSQGFLLPDLYDKITHAEQDAVIKVGNLNTKRDYTDVRDIVKGYCNIMFTDKLKHSIYNLCSGKSIAGTEIFDQLKISVNRPDVNYQIDPSLIRPTDALNIVGSSIRLQEETGWASEISIEQTIDDFVQWKKNSAE